MDSVYQGREIDIFTGLEWTPALKREFDKNLEFLWNFCSPMDSDSSQDLFTIDDINNTSLSAISMTITTSTESTESNCLPQELLGNIQAFNLEDKELIINNFISKDATNPKSRVGVNDFQVLSVIGKGAYGKVYLVNHLFEYYKILLYIGAKK